jgi:excisionase family DNA binding protein
MIFASIINQKLIKMQENLNVTFEQLPNVVARLFQKVSNIESLLLETSTNPEPEKEQLTAWEACQLLNIRMSTLYSKCSRKELPYHKPDGTKKLMFKRSELMEYLNSGRVRTADEVYQDATIILKKRL